MSVPTVLHDYIAGAIGGCAGIVIGHPFDTVKVQLQTQTGVNRFPGLLSCFKTVRNQKLSRGFFRGLSWPLFSYGFLNSVFFGVYGKVLSGMTSTSRRDNQYLSIFLAGSFAGLAQVVIACPVDVIKVVLQSQIPKHSGHKLPKYYNGPLSAFKDILRLRGIPGLYRGFGTQIFCDVPTAGFYMFMYEYTRTKLSTGNRSMLMVDFISGGISGVLTWMIAYPFDVVKSRLQADTERKIFPGFWSCAIKSYQAEGIKVFFRGGTMICMCAFPCNAVTLMIYSQCLRILGNGNLELT